MTPEQFVAKWKSAKLNERQAAQSHWNDLCAQFQRPKRLHQTHLKLDRAVLAAYGWQDIYPQDLTATHRPNPKEQAKTRQTVAEELS